MFITYSLLINTMCLLFPISIYLIYVFCVKTIDSKEKSIFFDLTLFSMMYMLLRYGERLNSLYTLMIFNLPLFICYLKQRKISGMVVSLVLAFYSYLNFGFSLVLLFLEYSLYYIIYYVFSRKNMELVKFIYPYIIVRVFFISIETILYIMPGGGILNISLYVLISSFILIGFNYIVLYLFRKAMDVVNYRDTLEELSHEKDLRCALFKITHEVKNPLAVCKGYLDMLKDADISKYEKYIPIIDSEIKRTLVLMDDFLDYTKVKVEMEDADLGMLIEEVLVELDPLFKKNKVSVNVLIPDMDIYAELDYNRMKQVFVNIFKNSMEASRGDLVIDVSVIFDEDSVVVKISDNGIGIPEDIINRIGETFFTTKERGTGLGVRLSMEIVELHGGKMYYESVYGEGCSVFVRLPYNEEVEDECYSHLEKVACCD